MEKDQQLYTIREAAEILRISRTTLFECLKKGTLKRLKISTRKVFITADELKRFIAATV